MEPEFSTWTVKKLKDKLRELGLKVSGNKTDLIQRIRSTESKYSNMTVVYLKTLLKDRNLLLAGRKADLITRLEDSDNEKISSPKLFDPEFPKELQQEILLNLEDNDLTKTCRTNKQAAKICEDDDFWRLRIQKIYNSDLSNYKEKDKTYRDTYIQLRKYERESDTRLFIAAAELGYLPIIKYLIEEKGEKATATLGLYTVLVAAAQNGHLQVVNYLVQHGANVNVPIGMPLIGASSTGHLSVVKYLVEHGANQGLENALRWAAENGHLPVVIYLIEREADIHTDSDNALRLASKNGHLAVVKYLIESGANIHATSGVGTDYSDDSLRLALIYKHYLVVKYLLEQGANIRDAITSIKDLKDLLRAWKLPVSGSKEVIFKRIMKYIRSNDT